jgi:uncharacterized membrane protein
MATDRATGVATDWAFFRRWLLVVTLGEVAGFALPAVVGPLTIDQPAGISYTALVGAGLVEGAVLGWAQWSVARLRLLALSRRRWVGLTSVGAAVAYAIALLAPTFWDQLSEWAIGLQVLVFAVGGTLLLLTIGTAQWVELRRQVPAAARWIAVTALAWCLALAVFFAVATPLWQEGQAFWLTLVIGMGAGLAMALTMSAVTGWGLVRLTRYLR